MHTVGSKMLELTGGQQVHMKSEDFKDKIMMSSGNKYVKMLQSEVPQPPHTWCPGPPNSDLGQGHVTTLQRGLHRWKDLPQPSDVSSHATCNHIC